MKPLVAIIAPGQMGSAVAKRLTENGLDTVTVLEGRSRATIARARAASMTPIALHAVCEVDIILSIVPPGEAQALARNVAPVLTASQRKPIYVDCNAVSPRTVEILAAIIAPSGAHFVDAGIIGGPPTIGAPGPIFYLSGERAPDVAVLGDFGLECKPLTGGIGAASALKLSYAGITKGLTALASIMILAASREGMAADLRAELAHSQPMLLAWFERQIPSMFAKSYRWVAEMEEIAEFVSRDEAGEDLFIGAAHLYERLAADFADAKDETGTLARFFEKPE